MQHVQRDDERSLAKAANTVDVCVQSVQCLGTACSASSTSSPAGHRRGSEGAWQEAQGVSDHVLQAHAHTGRAKVPVF